MRNLVLAVLGALLLLAPARTAHAAALTSFAPSPRDSLAIPVQYPPYVCGYSYNHCGYPRPYRPHHFCASLHFRCIDKAHRDLYNYPWSDFRSNYIGCMRYDGCYPRRHRFPY